MTFCVICNSKSFYSLIFKLCIMIVHTLNMCLSFLCKFYKHFLIFRAVELRHFFPSEMLRGCLVCVICKSSSFHSFIFKLCIMIVDIFFHPKCLGVSCLCKSVTQLKQFSFLYIQTLYYDCSHIEHVHLIFMHI